MAFRFYKTFPTPKEKREGANTCEFIIIHHTGSGKGTANGVINGLAYRDDFASCHFFVDENGKAYKFGEPTDILFHAGVSSWGLKKDLNRYALGIEIQGPLGGVGKENFTDAQRKTVRELVQHLMAVFSIPKENVLRHADVTQYGPYSIAKILWDGKRKARKVDVADSFWKIDRTSYKEYQQSLVPKEAV